MIKSAEQRKSRGKSRKSSKKLHRKLWRKLKRMMIPESAPKEYRPFLGHDASKEDVEKLKFKNTRAKLNKPQRKQRKNKRPFLLSFTK